MVVKPFTREEVAQHATAGDLLIIIDSKVYDLSKFSSLHPGGLSVLLDSEIAGQDATERFYELHRAEVLEKYARLQVGVIQGEPEIANRVPGALSQVPYAEPTWLASGYHTPYYKEHHRRFQKVYRKFVEEVVLPDAQARETDGQPPSQHIVDEMCRLNILAMQIGPGKHMKGRVLMDGVISLEEFDPFIELIITQDAARLHARGYNDGLGGGTIIGLPPVINFAQPALRDRVVEDALSGKRPICLAVTEAFAGSDVSGIRTRARKTEDGFWIVSGTAPISRAIKANRSRFQELRNGSRQVTGTRAHWFTTACKTDDGEIIVLLIERGEGVETKPIKTFYSATAGTAFVTFDNVKVPDANRLGPGVPGLLIILANFNHERWVLVAHNIARQRVIFEECLKWATQRKVFGKPLSSQAIVRQKLAAMISRFESCQAWIESITYQMCHMSPMEQAQQLAGQIAFLKMYATRESQKTAADAVQIFGGRGITKTGMFFEWGASLNMCFHHSLLIDAVGGGAEDVLGDLGVRQALRNLPRNARL
ncbi:Cytochrome b5 heme-binding domain-containing protein [Mycena indigotica]|uniref:Cytochrome b5 heme-binding domain-containing protein n=1 Tax=Mycena indigotica TaxID=2126181 RepID=A0A8H6T7H2_9AGAR|nr:Cytochrome b5 heme-binding domain-containing protein [Mycena indigotica]KAF7312330.1 Cytochrome b5 heme-binding domain-containing protein [Mycena indigotica]